MESEPILILSPLMGTFWRTPSPDNPPLVKVGDAVQPGQVIGLIEAMKVFNEIIYEGDKPGIVTEAKADGEFVKEDEVLVWLRPLE